MINGDAAKTSLGQIFFFHISVSVCLTIKMLVSTPLPIILLVCTAAYSLVQLHNHCYNCIFKSPRGATHTEMTNITLNANIYIIYFGYLDNLDLIIEHPSTPTRKDHSNMISVYICRSNAYFDWQCAMTINIV